MGVNARSFVCLFYLLASCCFCFGVDTNEGGRPEVEPEVENNAFWKGLIVSGGPHYVFPVGQSKRPDVTEQEEMTPDVARHIVKRQEDTTADGEQYVEKCGETLSLARSFYADRQPLHYSLAYNTKDNDYLLVYDVGDPSTGLPKYVNAASFNPLCVPHPGTKIGERLLSYLRTFRVYQGWPAAAYNPDRNEYLVIYQLATRRTFVLIGQRLAPKIARLELDGLPFYAFDFQRRGVRLSVTSAALIYVPTTSGYAVAAEVRISYMNVFMGCLTGSGSVFHYNRVYAFRASSAYNPEIVYDPVNNEVFVVATADRSALFRAHTLRVKTSSCVSANDSYVLLITKRTARCRSVNLWKKPLAFGSSKLRFPRVQVTWDASSEVLIATWDTIDNNGKKVSRTAIIDGRNVQCDSQNCPDKRPIQHASQLYHPLCNRTVSVWEEQIDSQWYIGGSDFPAGFVSRSLSGQSESYPNLIYHQREDRLMVVWKNKVDNRTTISARCLCRAPEAPCPLSNDTIDVCWVTEDENYFLISGTVVDVSSCGDLLCYTIGIVTIHQGPLSLQEDPLFTSQQSLHVCMKTPLCCPELEEGVKYFLMGRATDSQLIVPLDGDNVMVWSSDDESYVLESLENC